jgi:hypothetical protein
MGNLDVAETGRAGGSGLMLVDPLEVIRSAADAAMVLASRSTQQCHVRKRIATPSSYRIFTSRMLPADSLSME